MTTDTVPNFCSICGAARAGDFCAGCGASLKGQLAIAPRPTARLTAPPARAGRNGGNVAWGVFWGFLTWPSVFFMLRINPGPKREDRFFGYWMGLGAGLVIGPLVVLALAAASSATSSLSPATGHVQTGEQPLLTDSQIDSIVSETVVPGGQLNASTRYTVGGRLSLNLRLPAGSYTHWDCLARGEAPGGRTADYEPADHDWRSTCTFTDSAGSPVTRIVLIDDRTGKAHIQ